MKRVLFLLILTFTITSTSLTGLDSGQVTNDAVEERLRFIERRIDDEVHQVRPRKKIQKTTRRRQLKRQADKRLHESLERWLEQQVQDSPYQ